jgi:hypothetical protein
VSQSGPSIGNCGMGRYLDATDQQTDIDRSQCTDLHVGHRLGTATDLVFNEPAKVVWQVESGFGH